MRHFSCVIFLTCALAAILWGQASAGAVDVEGMKALDQQRQAMELGGGEEDYRHHHQLAEKEAIHQVQHHKQFQSKDNSHLLEQESQHSQHQIDQVVEVKPAAVGSSLYLAGYAMFNWATDSKETEGENGAVASLIARDPLTTLISIVSVGAAIAYWLIIRSKSDARHRRAQQKINNSNSKKINNNNNNNNKLNNKNNVIEEEDESAFDFDNSTPSTPSYPVTRVGGPRSSIPLVTKINHLSCMVSVKMGMKKRVYSNDDVAICFYHLRKVSRSFAMVIEDLCDELRLPVCIFYIVLRALDTVEDDVNISREEKVKHLKAFGDYLDAPEAVPEEVTKYGEGDYLPLMADFARVVAVHNTLRKEYKDTIVATTRRMAHGMLQFLDSQNNVQTQQEYNEYCFYVAATVGLGLTDMWAASGLEPGLANTATPYIDAPLNEAIASAYTGGSAVASAVAMGLLLQKTNIIRDYAEDVADSRLWWPKQVWSKHADHFTDFQKEEQTAAGLGCLNELIVDAMRHLPGCLNYLKRIQDPSVFSFCAVPQGMAIATLTTCFNNPNVFHRNVKISKGEACSAMLACRSIKSFTTWVGTYVRELQAKTQVDPVFFAEAREALAAAAISLNELSA